MNLALSKYVFFSNYVNLPLSAIKYIINNENSPFHNINELNRQEIETELSFLNKQPKIILRGIKEKAKKIKNLLQENYIELIAEKIKYWKDLGIKILTYFNDDYPKRLKLIKNPPKIIFYKGIFKFSYEKAISIVGTREPSNYGANFSREMGKRFAELGFTIINGFAKGIDIEAIKGCLDADGRVIGVLGSGLLKPYPKENLELFDEIIDKERGIFISEQLPDTSITKSNLALRNRISSGMSLGNVFVEGGINSGARWQLKYGIEQKKNIITVEHPEKKIEQAELPNHIIRNKMYDYLINNIEDIEIIVNSILKKSKNTQKSLCDF
ncbi:MAG: DNA-processing protein DprA [Candidatus Hermodarchaeota archaeon]